MFDCVNMALHVQLGGEFTLLGIAHPILGPLFRYREYACGRCSLEAAVMKKVVLWLVINFFVTKLGTN